MSREQGASTLAEITTEARRAAILELLMDSGEQSAEVLTIALRRLSFPKTLEEEVGRDLDWLKARRLIEDRFLDDVRMSAISKRGRDAACGPLR